MAATPHGGADAGRLTPLPEGFRFPSELRFPVFAARDGACLQKQTAAPAPPRLFLPQAAARLRSHPPSSGVPLSLRDIPLPGDGIFSCSPTQKEQESVLEPVFPLLALSQRKARCN